MARRSKKDWETTEVAWAIVKDGRAMKKEGHGRAFEWARAYLGLEDRRPVVPPPDHVDS
jgi:hypothetical protein